MSAGPCSTPWKRQFTKAAAKVARSNRGTMRMYRCACGWHHLTSQTKAEDKAARARRREREEHAAATTALDARGGSWAVTVPDEGDRGTGTVSGGAGVTQA